MAMTFPLSTTDFMRALPVAEITFDAPEQVEVNQTAGGEIITGDLGPMLWQGEVRLGTMTHAEASHADVMLDLLRPSGRMFYAYDVRRPAPLADPQGLILGATVPVIGSLIAENREMTLEDLPGWYVLSRGDYLAFDYGSPARRALHKVVTAQVQADAAGTTPTFEVTPLIRPGATVGAAVTLVRASCLARIVPNTVSKGQSLRTITRDASFRFIQSLNT